MTKFVNIRFLLSVILYLNVFRLFECTEYSVRVTKYGRVKGIVEEVHGQKKVEKFFGIPYASPPIGKLRFEDPVPPTPWGDVIKNTTVLPPACPQPTEGVAYIEYHVPDFNRTSEDCLYVNVYVPRGAHTHKSMPVFVFIHGGSYQNGMGAMFDGSILASHGIVVVTFNYRLGPLGFITSTDGVLRGNYGMLDMVASLKWVQENIANFNGDPNRVTIDGHSAGGCSVGLLLMSPLAKGLFHRVIQQSGSPLGQWAVSRYETKPSFIYKIFTSSLNCYNSSSHEVKACLQKLDSDTLHDVIIEEFEWGTSLTPKYRPVVDGYFLPHTPEYMVENEPLNAATFMTGATKDEGLIAAIPLIKLFGVGKTGFRKLMSLMSCFRGDLPEIPGIVDSILEEYVSLRSSDITEDEIQTIFSEIVGDYFITAPTHQLASSLSQRNVTVYLYNYEYLPELDGWGGVIHGAELFYLSGCPFTGHKNFRYNHVDEKMAKMLLLLWSNFIKHGVATLEPRHEVNLPPFDSKRKTYSKIYSLNKEPQITIMEDLRHDKISFWNEEVPRMMLDEMAHREEITQSKYVKNTGDKYSYINNKSTWILASVCIALSVIIIVLSIQNLKIRKEVSILIRQTSVSSKEKMLSGFQT